MRINSTLLTYQEIPSMILNHINVIQVRISNPTQVFQSILKKRDAFDKQKDSTKVFMKKMTRSLERKLFNNEFPEIFLETFDRTN